MSSTRNPARAGGQALPPLSGSPLVAAFSRAQRIVEAKREDDADDSDVDDDIPDLSVGDFLLVRSADDDDLPVWVVCVESTANMPQSVLGRYYDVAKPRGKPRSLKGKWVEQPGDENLVTVTVTGDDKMFFLYDFKLTPHTQQ